MFDVKFSNSAEKFLKKAEKEIAERAIQKIETLRENPFPQNCRRVEGKKKKIFRVRIGKIRITYTITKEENILFVSDIDKRPRIYD